MASLAHAIGGSATGYISVGRSLSSLAEGGTSLALNGGVSLRFSAAQSDAVDRTGRPARPAATSERRRHTIAAMAAATEFERFLIAFPDYDSTSALDELRAAEYAHLDDGGHTYLDYTGACLYAASQVREHAEWMASGVFGNPHSAQPGVVGRHGGRRKDPPRRAALVQRAPATTSACSRRTPAPR